MPVIDQEFIPPKKEQLNIRLDPEVIGMLNRYCVFLNSGQHYVVEQALRYMFAKDRDFQTWLTTQETTGEEGDGADSIARHQRQVPGRNRCSDNSSMPEPLLTTAWRHWSGRPAGF